MPLSHVLIIDDDDNIRSSLKRALSYAGFTVEVAEDGEEGLQKALVTPPDVVVLDIMMPGLSGLEVCRRLREGDDGPILMLTAKDDIPDRVTGLEAGADDYLIKPFALEELIARLKALLRRREPQGTNRLGFADLTIHLGTREAYRGCRLLQLTAKEFDLLATFLRNPRRVLSRDQLISFTVGVYSLLARNLLNEVDRSLAERADQVNSAVRLSPGFPPGSGLSITIPRPDTFTSADTFVQVVSLDGEVVGSSQNWGDVSLPVTGEDLESAQSGSQRYDLTELDGERIRILSAPLTVRDQPVGLIQVARSLERVDQVLGQLRLIAGVGLIISLSLSTLVVWFTTRAALRPLEQVIETSDAIGSSGDLARRVDASTSGDEVGRLSSTFNRMLDRLETSAQSLQAAYERLDTALSAQRRFVADASHELRTPLTTIRSNASLLSQYPQVTPEDRKAAIAQISQEAERMSRLVNGLLTLARADAGQALEGQPVALGLVVKEVVSQSRTLSGGQHLIEAKIELVGPIWGNSDSLRQLVLILMENATKYTQPEGRIKVSLEENAGRVTLTVADNGVGIAPEDLPHIFERFYRADRGRKAGGTGLGLSIAKWIVEQHGAVIHATSTPGQGTTFTVSFALINLPPSSVG
jgi:two-component system, OmpR family, sensor kinase